MDINRANMEIFFTEARAEWTNAMNAARENLIANNIALTVTSKTSVTNHGWLNQIPSMKKWVGPRIADNLSTNKVQVTNAKYVNTIEITREEFEDDEYGLYLPTFGLMGTDAVAIKDRTLIDSLLQGTTTKWSGDNQVIFTASARTYGAATIANYVTSTYDAAGTALTTAVAAMASYQGHGGVPLMVKPYAILYGPSLRQKVQQSLSAYGALLAANASTYVGGQIENPNANLVKMFETPYLINGYTDLDGNAYANAGTHWFILGQIGGVKGLVYQSRIEPELQDARSRLDSDFAFQNDKIQWGARARGAGFVGLPHLVYGGFATS